MALKTSMRVHGRIKHEFSFLAYNHALTANACTFFSPSCVILWKAFWCRASPTCKGQRRTHSTTLTLEDHAPTKLWITHLCVSSCTVKHLTYFPFLDLHADTACVPIFMYSIIIVYTQRRNCSRYSRFSIFREGCIDNIIYVHIWQHICQRSQSTYTRVYIYSTDDIYTEALYHAPTFCIRFPRLGLFG